MTTKAIEILSTIAEDNNNTSHSNLSLAYQAAVKVALHELQKPTPEPTHPLIDALNKHIRKMVDECVEHAVNGSFSDIEEKIADAESRLNSLENAENEDLSDVQRRLDDVEAYESRLEDLESWQRNSDDERSNDLENRIDDLESTQGDHEEQISDLLKEAALLEKAGTRSDEWSNKMEQRLETLEAASKLTSRDLVSRDLVLAITDYIRNNIA